MKFILIIVWLASQKATVLQTEFNTKAACEEAGRLVNQQVRNNDGTMADAFVCAAKG